MPAFNLTQGAAYIVITAIVGSIWTIFVWLIRLFIRLKIHPPFGLDDLHCTIATVFSILDAGLVLTQSGFGLGQHSSTLGAHTLNTQRILGWLAVISYIQASCFSILSVTFLLIRVTRLTAQARPAYLTAFATGLWGLTATTIVLFQCRLPAPWRTRPHSRCIDIYSAWCFITISRSIIELANVVIAAWLIWRLHMPVRPKVLIILMFTLRLLVIPPAITRLIYIKVSWQAADWSYARVRVQIITQVALHVSTILATIPCVKNFLLVFESGNLHAPTHVEDDERRLSKRQSSNYALRLPDAYQTSTPPLRELPRRMRSEHDFLRVPTHIRPGPLHTLRLSSWSAPGSLNAPATPGEPVELQTLRTIATAEYDPEDARSASLERRKSVDSEDSRKAIKRTHSFIVDWKKGDGQDKAGDAGMQRAKSQRQGSAGSRWSFYGEARLDEDRHEDDNGDEKSQDVEDSRERR